MFIHVHPKEAEIAVFQSSIEIELSQSHLPKCPKATVSDTGEVSYLKIHKQILNSSPITPRTYSETKHAIKL